MYATDYTAGRLHDDILNDLLDKCIHCKMHRTRIHRIFSDRNARPIEQTIRLLLELWEGREKPLEPTE